MMMIMDMIDEYNANDKVGQIFIRLTDDDNEQN